MGAVEQGVFPGPAGTHMGTPVRVWQNWMGEIVPVIAKGRRILVQEFSLALFVHLLVSPRVISRQTFFLSFMSNPMVLSLVAK
jgi:hypothetical protein